MLAAGAPERRRAARRGSATSARRSRWRRVRRTRCCRARAGARPLSAAADRAEPRRRGAVQLTADGHATLARLTATGEQRLATCSRTGARRSTPTWRGLIAASARGVLHRHLGAAQDRSPTRRRRQRWLSAPGWIRTSDPRIRSPMLYPAELRGRAMICPMVPYLGALEQKSVKVPCMSPVESDEEDLTRKQRREQARAERKAMEEAAARERGAANATDAAGNRGGGRRGGDRRDPDRERRRRKQRHPAQARTDLGDERSRTPDRRHPPERQHARQPDGAGDAAVLRRPRVPDLPEIHAGRAADGHPEMGAHGQAEDRIPLAGDGDARTGNVQDCSRSRPTRRASRTRRGTSSRPSTTSREKRTRAT